MQCIAWVGLWDTAKTTTFELTVGTKHGIISLKEMITNNGHASKVYSGFDECSWENDGELPVFGDLRFWEHRYIASVQRGAVKNAGWFEQIDPCEIGHMFARTNLTRPGLEKHIDAIEHGISTQHGINTHWQMLKGSLAGQSSSPKAAGRAEFNHTKKVERVKELIAADDGFGIF